MSQPVESRHRRAASPFAAVVLLAPLAAALPARAGDPGWPRQIDVPKGTVLVYEPQVESMKGDRLDVRAAISIAEKGKEEPVFGAIWATARVRTDRNAGTASFVSAKVNRVRFPEITPERERELAGLVEEQVGRWNIVLSLDRLTALLATAEREQKTADQLSAEPPRILVENELAVLVLIDGEPRLQKVEGSSLEHVVNTPFGILFDPKGRTYYVSNGDVWYRSSAATGPYAVTTRVPAEVAKVAEAARKAQRETEKEEGIAERPRTDRPPKLVVVTEPAELIAFDGEPAWVPVPGLSDLLYASNTESNVLKDLVSQDAFVLLSGRWFRSRSLSGPWAFVEADRLPESFARIPEGSPAADVLPFVAGTKLAEDARLDAEIPQTTAVKRAGTTVDVRYDGEPQFEQIEGAPLRRAANASTVVLSSGTRYYACDQGVWFEASSPEGPWSVATERPAGVDAIPPSSPAYNAKYVYVYDVTPEVVYVGYTPGYVGTYVWGPTVVYGTGYHYRPWYRRSYYPWPSTWGFSVRYNPWTGWSFGFGFSSGFFSFGTGWRAGGWYGPPGHWHGGGWFGPCGWRPPIWGPGYRPGRPYNSITINVHNNHYGRPGSSRPGGTRPGGWQPPRPPSNLYARPSSRERIAADYRPAPRPSGTREARPGSGRPGTKEARPATSGSREARPATRDVPRQPPAAKGRPNDVFADRDGNVYRRDKDGWQTREQGSWTRPSGGPGASRERPSAAPGSLDRDWAARERSRERVQAAQPRSQGRETKAAPKSVPSRPQGREGGGHGEKGQRRN